MNTLKIAQYSFGDTMDDIVHVELLGTLGYRDGQIEARVVKGAPTAKQIRWAVDRVLAGTGFKRDGKREDALGGWGYVFRVIDEDALR